MSTQELQQSWHHGGNWDRELERSDKVEQQREEEGVEEDQLNWCRGWGYGILLRSGGSEVCVWYRLKNFLFFLMPNQKSSL